MKTTVEISDALLAEAKALAAREGTTLRALIERGLREAVARRRGTSGYRLRRVTVTGNGLSPLAADGAWDRIRQLAYEGRGG